MFLWNSRKLGLDLVPRNGPLAVDPHKCGIVSLHQVHVNSAENAKASSVSLRRTKATSIYINMSGELFLKFHVALNCRVAAHCDARRPKRFSRITCTFACVTSVTESVTTLRCISTCTMATSAECGHCPSDFWWKYRRRGFPIMWKSCTAIAPFLLIWVKLMTVV